MPHHIAPAKPYNPIDFEGSFFVNDLRLHCVVRGHGHPLVFLHAGFLDGRMWDAECREFERVRLTVGYDRRGFGRSEGKPGPYSDCDDLVALLEVLNLSQGDVVAISDSAPIALELAVRRPDLVRSLVLTSPLLPDQLVPSGGDLSEVDWSILGRREMEIRWTLQMEGMEPACERLLELWGPALEPSIRLTLLRIIAENAAMSLGEARLSLPPDLETLGQISHVECPCLILTGDRDLKIVRALGRWLRDHLPQGRYREIAGADHLVNWSQPTEFRRELRSFLGSSSPVAEEPRPPSEW